MDTLANNEIIECCSGAANELYLMTKLMGQIFIILIVGIVLWRLSAMVNRKRVNKENRYFKRNF